MNSNKRNMSEAANSRGNQQYSGIMGGSDSFTIIGTSGIGKSSAISRALNLIMANQIIQLEEPYVKIIPCITVQCPYDSSVKGMLLEILRKVDEELETTYYKSALRARATIDMLIGSVSQVCLNHVGLLIIDEIQNVVNSKNGKSLIGSLTQLINNSGISIGMIGTPESEIFFGQAMQLARRSLGLKYTALPYDAYFHEVCDTLFHYQYVKKHTELTDGIVRWLYEHSAGIISIAVSLVHDAQEIAIFEKETGRKRMEDAKEYILSNWMAAKLRLRHQEGVKGSSTEGHVSHVLSSRMSSRPMGWSVEGAGKMAKLRAYEMNGGDMLELIRYQKRELPKAAGSEYEVLSSKEIIHSERNRHGELGKYLEAISHSMSIQNKKIVCFNSHIYGL